MSRRCVVPRSKGDLTVPRSLQPGLKSVVDQTSYQPAQGDVPFLSDFAEVAEEIVGQDNVDLRIASIANLRLRSTGGIHMRFRDRTGIGEHRAGS